MGFSLAVGAMFAGLAYSRDPEEHRIDKGFELIYQFFARSSLSVSGWSLT